MHDHLEDYKNRFTWFKKTRFELETEALRDEDMKELLNRVQDKSGFCMQFQLWESARADDFGTGKDNVKKCKDALTKAIRARAYTLRSGREFDAFRKEISNRCVARTREKPHNVSEDYMQM